MSEALGTGFWIAALALAHFVQFGVRALLITGTATLFVHKSRFAERRRIYREPYESSLLRTQFLATVAVTAFDSVAIALVRHFDLIHFAPPTVAGVLLTWAGLFVYNEVWYYVMHRSLHSDALYFIHAQHHVARVAHPFSSFSFSLVERTVHVLGVLGPIAIASHFIPITLPGFVLCFFTQFLFNTLGHLNVEPFGLGFLRSWAGRTLVTSTYHAMHHARERGHYGLATQVLDRLFGTMWKDYPEVYAAAVRGEGNALDETHGSDPHEVQAIS